MVNNKIIIGVVILIVILLGGYFAVKAMNKTAAPTPTPVTEQSTSSTSSAPTSSASPAATQTINVSGTDFAFTPSTIKLKSGEPVKIVFTNNGKFPHNFTIADLNVKSKNIMPGESDSVSFTPAKTGSFTYVCTVPGHADKGMTGTLTVN